MSTAGDVKLSHFLQLTPGEGQPLDIRPISPEVHTIELDLRPLYLSRMHQLTVNERVELVVLASDLHGVGHVGHGLEVVLWSVIEDKVLRGILVAPRVVVFGSVEAVPYSGHQLPFSVHDCIVHFKAEVDFVVVH